MTKGARKPERDESDPLSPVAMWQVVAITAGFLLVMFGGPVLLWIIYYVCHLIKENGW